MAEICMPEQSDINETTFSKDRRVIYKSDILGRQLSSNKQSGTLIYFFDDGTYEKRFSIFNSSGR